MRIKRLLLSVIAAPALIAVSVLATGTAQATPPAKDTAAVQWHRLPAAPAASQVSALRATAPSTAPAAGYVEYSPGSVAPCSRGVLCTAVWNPVSLKWRQFNLSACNLYNVFYWQNGGYYFDNQTGGVRSYFYGQSGNVLLSFTPDATQRDYNWDRVYSVRNC
ncbi:hypothetical protein ABZ589_34950 [Streptomyces sp. NPDC013313]|uniref:hypothetical protein n=1 Tax=Streptomyces sp. NPDC013313 TaxID=3155603 RepID=UPI0033E8A2DC